MTRRRGVIAVVAVAAVAAVVVSAGSAAASQQLEARLLRTYDAFDANQGVAVDRSSFFAVDNRQITKHDRQTGTAQLQFAGNSGGPLILMDSGRGGQSSSRVKGSLRCGTLCAIASEPA